MYDHDSDFPAKTRQHRLDMISFSRDQLNVFDALFKAFIHPDEITRINVAKTIDVGKRAFKSGYKMDVSGEDTRRSLRGTDLLAGKCARRGTFTSDLFGQTRITMVTR